MIKLSLVNPDDIYLSITNGKPFDKNLRPFTQTEIESAIRQFIEDEEYEKCAFLKNFIDKRYNHENGWKKPTTF